ncbi:hypothetical protein ABPG75_006621 [Micractinium tetrahymenae]
MVSRLAFDALSAVALALTALLGAYAPAYLAKRDKLAGGSGRSLTYVLGNMLSAGVMVSAGFCHLLGEALKQMPKMQFPLAPFLCGTGYLFTLVADRIAASAHGGHGGCAHHSLPSKVPAVDSCCAVEVLAGMDIAERGLEKHSSEPEAVGLLNRPPSRGGRHPDDDDGSSGSGRVLTGASLSSAGSHQRHLHAHTANGHSSRHASGELLRGGSAGSGALHEQQQQHGGPSLNSAAADGDAGGYLEEGLGGGSGSSGRAVLDLPRPSIDGCTGSGQRAGRQRGSSDSLPFEVGLPEGAVADGPLLGGPAGTGGSRRVSFLTAMLMGVALCFHSLLEGAAMGAQPTISNSLHIFIAIVSHKGLAAYALGSSIVDSDASMRRFWSVVLPFTFASPVGIFLGYVVSDVARGVGAASISALASGTFLYVAFMEVVPKELRDQEHIPLKLAALLAGFAAMSVLAIWA